MIFPTNLPGLTASPVRSTTFNASYGNLFLEFQDHTVRVYGKTKAGLVHRGDYFSMNMQPLGPYTVNFTIPTINFMTEPFMAPIWTSTSTLEIRYRMRNRFYGFYNASLIFEFNRQSSSFEINGDRVKFSASMMSALSSPLFLDLLFVLHSSLADINATHNTSSLFFPLVVTYHTQHSVPGGEPIFCPVFNATKLEACTSSVANVTFELRSDRAFLDTTVIGLHNKRASLSFAYGTNGEVDGHDLLSSGELWVERILEGIGNAHHIYRFFEGNRTDLAPRANAIEDQALSLPLGIKVAPFNVLYYDPDISLALLFDDAATANGTGLITNPDGQPLGLIIGVTVAGVAIVAVAIGVFFYVRAKRGQKQSQRKLHEKLSYSQGSATPPPPVERSTVSDPKKWTQGNSNRSQATNLLEDEKAASSS